MARNSECRAGGSPYILNGRANSLHGFAPKLCHSDPPTLRFRANSPSRRRLLAKADAPTRRQPCAKSAPPLRQPPATAAPTDCTPNVSHRATPAPTPMSFAPRLRASELPTFHRFVRASDPRILRLRRRSVARVLMLANPDAVSNRDRRSTWPTVSNAHSRAPSGQNSGASWRTCAVIGRLAAQVSKLAPLSYGQAIA